MAYDKAKFKEECDRRREEGLVVKGNTFPIKDQIKALGGIWDGMNKQWLMPDEKAVSECNVALGLGDGPPTEAAPDAAPEDDAAAGDLETEEMPF